MLKHRTSIEFPADLWKQLSRNVPPRKRSNFIIEAIKDKLGKESIKALIVCGGEGTRLRPLTLSTPKAMLPLGYKPFLEHLILKLKEQGIYNFCLSIGYLGEHIIKYFNDGSSLGVKIEYVSEKEPLGTAGAIKNASSKFNSTFLVIFGDVLFGKLDIKEILQFHKERKALATIVLKELSDTKRFGLVNFDETSKILEFIEKPKFSRPGWINAGIYVFEPEIFNYIPSKKFCSMEKQIFPDLAEKGKLFGFKYYDYWNDIGLPEDYERAMRDFLLEKVK